MESIRGLEPCCAGSNPAPLTIVYMVKPTNLVWGGQGAGYSKKPAVYTKVSSCKGDNVTNVV